MNEYRYQHCIVRTPSHSCLEGITTSAFLGKVDYENAIRQHEAYIRALEQTGVRVKVLPARKEFPDSCFVEDVAVISPYGAIVTNPGAPSRNGEKEAIIPALKEFFPEEKIYYLQNPGTMDGGDVLLIENCYYVGISRRTNVDGFCQFREIGRGFGMDAVAVPVTDILHLKTGVVYVGEGRVLISGEFIRRPEFDGFEKFEVPEEEAYGANIIRMNGKIIVASGYPSVSRKLREWGYDIIETDTSEYKKIDGGLTCLSLRF